MDYLKIDQSFVAMIGTNALSVIFLTAPSAWRPGWGCKPSPKVETQEQADFLVERRVDYLQGYLYGRPLTRSNFCSS